MYIKRSTSVLSILMVVTALALIGMSPGGRALLINSWSVQYSRQMLNPTKKQSTLIDPPAGHARAAFWLASAALQSGNPALAEKLITTQAAQGDLLSMHVMSDALIAQGDFTEAVSTWQKVGDAASLLRVATQAEQVGRLEDAHLAYQTAWRLDPESCTLPLVNFLLTNERNYSSAENVLQQSMTALPNSRNWPVWSNHLGDVLRSQKHWGEAIKIYEGTLVHSPDYWVAHIGIGWAMYERGDDLQAVMSEFQKAINAPRSQGNGQLAIAQILTREKQFEEADTWFAQALALNPSYRWWYVARGNAARQAGNLRLALTVYQEVLARFPDFAPAYYEISYAYQLNEQPSKAITAIEQALSFMVPSNADYYARAGGIYEWAGDINQALYAYRQALLIDTQNSIALQGVKRLEK